MHPFIVKIIQNTNTVRTVITIIKSLISKDEMVLSLPPKSSGTEKWTPSYCRLSFLDIHLNFFNFLMTAPQK